MNYILVITLLFFTTVYSQDKVGSTFIFSKYENFDYEKKGNQVRDIVNEDNEALIVYLDDSKYISLKNNKVKCYTVCKDTIINNIVELNNIDVMICKSIIDTLVSIDPKKIINEIDKENSILIENLGRYMVSFYKDNKTLKLFYSYSSETNFEDKFSFPKDRKTFLNNYLNLTKYFYDKEFERLKSLDTIYLLIEKKENTQYEQSNFSDTTYSTIVKKGKNMTYIVGINKLKNIRQENYDFQFNCSYVSFINLNRFSSAEPANVFYEKESFLKTNSDKILRLEDLQRFTQCDLELLIGSNYKKVFIIDKDDIRSGKIKIKEVKGGTRCWSEHQED
ncbi:hypothetical protein BC952_1346 [Flavobacterium limicola]|uniref:Uncharacterized protein n=1 Tax=Flavobacterium limicola TaxID=180441 RepID=A0A495S7N6_9FLAO|nr:hypothetical protein [Flavobacterium limicola]RKS95649.1 hypothetical protein BC952_1346 [Flavobacterium limicola]